MMEVVRVVDYTDGTTSVSDLRLMNDCALGVMSDFDVRVGMLEMRAILDGVVVDEYVVRRMSDSTLSTSDVEAQLLLNCLRYVEELGILREELKLVCGEINRLRSELNDSHSELKVCQSQLSDTCTEFQKYKEAHTVSTLTEVVVIDDESVCVDDDFDLVFDIAHKNTVKTSQVLVDRVLQLHKIGKGFRTIAHEIMKDSDFVELHSRPYLNILGNTVNKSCKKFTISHTQVSSIVSSYGGGEVVKKQKGRKRKVTPQIEAFILNRTGTLESIAHDVWVEFGVSITPSSVRNTRRNSK